MPMKNNRNSLKNKKTLFREIRRVILQPAGQKVVKNNLDRMERIDRPETALKPTFEFKESRSSSRYVFEANGLEIGYDHPLLPKMDITIERGEKVAIIGCNGVGKSTLLKTMLGKIEPLNGKAERGDFLFPSYFEQEVKAGRAHTN